MAVLKNQKKRQHDWVLAHKGERQRMKESKRWHRLVGQAKELRFYSNYSRISAR